MIEFSSANGKLFCLLLLFLCFLDNFFSANFIAWIKKKGCLFWLDLNRKLEHQSLVSHFSYIFLTQSWYYNRQRHPQIILLPIIVHLKHFWFPDEVFRSEMGTIASAFFLLGFGILLSLTSGWSSSTEAEIMLTFL